MRKIILSVAMVLCIASATAGAQEIEDTLGIRSILNTLFSGIDKSKVPTGFLKDYAVELIDISIYDGTEINDNNYAFAKEFEEILRTIRSANVKSINPVPTVSGIIEGMVDNISDSTIPVGIVAYKYNYIRQDALTGGYLSYSNNIAYDSYNTAGEWQNPYLNSTVFAFSPIKNYSSSKNITFSFNAYSNLSYSQLEFDDGSGTGYRDVPSNLRLASSYSGNGIKELTLRMTLTGGDQIEAHSRVLINQVEDVITRGDGQPGSSVGTTDIASTRPYLGITANALVSYKKAALRQNDSIRKPLLIVEGFDVNRPATDTSKFDTGMNSIDSTGFWNAPKILNDYDLFYVDWGDAKTYIQANAYLLIDIIDYINARRASDADDIILYAESMGGLISSYALKTMENMDHPHNVSTFISADTPYLGANVPIGILHAANDLLFNFKVGKYSVDYLSDEILEDEQKDGLSFVKSLLGAESVKQMLINYVTSEGIIDNTVHTDFMNEFYSLGFPSGDKGQPLSMFAVSNGGTNNYTPDSILEAQGSINLGTLWDPLVPIMAAFGYKHIQSLPLDVRVGIFLPGTNTLEISANVYPFLTGGCTVYEMDANYKKKFLWLATITYPLYHQKKKAPSGFGLDSATGSYCDVSTIIEDTLSRNVSEDIVGIQVDYSYSIGKYFMFIPSASSLCIGRGQRTLTGTDYSRSYTMGNGYDTPFQDFYIDSNASQHISTDSAKNDWIYNHIRYSIVGSSCPVSGDIFSVSNLTVPVSWSTSDESIATINGNGEVQILSDGFVTIYASFIVSNTPVSLSKRVMIGFPDFYSTYDTQTELLYAHPADSEFWDFTQSTNVSYSWGITTQYGRIMWKYREVPYYKAKLSSTAVYFRARNDNYITPIIQFPKILFIPLYVNKQGDVFMNDAYSGDITASCITKCNESSTKYSITVKDKTYNFSEFPSPQVIGNILINGSEFSTIWNSVKPWGEENELLIRMTIHDRSTGESSDGAIIIMYNPSLSE